MNTKSYLVPNSNLSRAPHPPNARWMAGLVLALLAGAFGVAYGQIGYVPAAINYQGRLTNDKGEPVTPGNYQVKFKIWKDATSALAGNLVWNRVFAVHVVTNGMFNVLLSGDGPNSLLSAFDGPDRYLGLSIIDTPAGAVTEYEITPRQRLVSAPFAIHTYNAYKTEWASSATNAAFASSAQNATYATNSGKFSNFSTNDFLMVSKAAQTLTGSLTISNGTLTLRSNLVVSGSVTNTGDLTVGGNVKASGNLSVSGSVTNSSDLTVGGNVKASGYLTVSGNVTNSGNLVISGRTTIGPASARTSNPGLLEIESGTNNTPALRLSSAGQGHGSGVWLENRNGAGPRTNTWAIYSHANDGDLEFRYMNQDIVAMSIHTNLTVEFTPKPVAIRHYRLPTITSTQTAALSWTCTNYAVADWSAAVVGVKIGEEAARSLREFRMEHGTTYWTLKSGLSTESGSTNLPAADIEVDVMFIRKQWVDDPDR